MTRPRKNLIKALVAASVLASGFGAAGPVASQEDRDTRVRRDREAMRDSDLWLYNNLEAGVKAATRSGKPILIVFR